MVQKVVKVLLPILVLLGFEGKAQDIIQSRQYPKNIFRYPLDLPPSTAGSFGELRPNHFHAGLDFKTNHRTGYPVHAVYDGFVSRLRVQFGGFGNAVYITHPNGFTSVYGHLMRFSPEIAQMVKQVQYQQQKFDVDFNLQPWQLPVTRGQVIALSGNTGASEGPHLHFELRDSATQETINAQLFGLTIPDHVPPSIMAAAVYHLDGNPFSEKTPRDYYAVAGAAGHYHLAQPKTLELNGEIGFGITANDMNSTSNNHNGVYSIELKLDGKTVYTFVVERFAFDQTHAINAYIDYPVYLTSHRWIQKCFVLPGNKITLFPQSINRGIITFNDDAIHDVEYVVKDVAGNTSTLNLRVKSIPQPEHKEAADPPGSIRFHYDKENTYSNKDVKVTIQPGNLYDDLDFTYALLPRRPGTYSATHRIHNRFTPIHDSYDLWIKPDSTIGKLADKAVIVNEVTGSQGGVYEDGYVKAHATTFGDFYIKVDTVPPTIRPINIRNGCNLSVQHAIFLKISDNLSGVKSFEGKIDGKWVLMEWDYKTRVLSYTFDNTVTAGRHNFELTVVDNKDNTNHFSAEFTR